MEIKYLTLFVTARCDSNCVMCFNYSLDAAHTDELSLEEYRKIAKNLGSNLKSLLISGGEPSLREDLPEICELFYKHCDVKKIYLPLNGHDKERVIKSVEQILRLCPAVRLNVGLSIDGIGEIHDRQRGVRGSFDRVMDSHEALFTVAKQYKNLKRGVITTVTRINVNELERFADYIYNLPTRPDYHDIMACRIQAGSKTKREFLISLDEYKKVLTIANRYAYVYSGKRHGNFILGTMAYLRHNALNYIYLNAYKKKRIIKCKAPEFSRVMEANGRIRICELKEERGNIRDYDYDLNKMGRILNLSSEKVNCACTHPCFVVPSLSGYPSNAFRFVKSILRDKVSSRRVDR